jgi:hypothetical protein
MPEICRFYGNIIRMHHDELTPPHISPHDGEHYAAFGIFGLFVKADGLPPGALGLVMEWGALHQAGLIDRRARARNFSPIQPIDPLP